MWRCFSILVLLCGYILLINGGQQQDITEIVSSASKTLLEHQGPAAIVFGNPPSMYFGRRGVRMKHRQDNKEKTKRNKWQRKRKHDSTRATTKKSFKRKLLLYKVKMN